MESLLDTSLPAGPRWWWPWPGPGRAGLARPTMAFHRLGTLGGFGVPSNNGCEAGTMGNGASFGAWAARLEPAAVRTRINDRSFTIQATLVLRIQMNRALAPCLAIFAAALALRIPDLATGRCTPRGVLADKFGGLLETGSFAYDPQDYHGPALAWLTLAPARLAGAHRYVDLTETTLRVVPAVCGVAARANAAAAVDGLGRWGAVAAGRAHGHLAGDVYYSRLLHPEMLLTTLTCAAIVCGYRYARSGEAVWAIAAALARAHVPHQGDGGDRDCVHAGGAGRDGEAQAASDLAGGGGRRNCDSDSGCGARIHRWLARVDELLATGLHASVHRHPWDYYLGLLIRNEWLIVAAAVAGATRKGGCPGSWPCMHVP